MDEKSKNEKVNFLWNFFLDGDEKSFATIYHLHITGLLSYGYKFTRDHELVQDCVQDVFVDLFLKRQKINSRIENIKAYLFKALRNRILKKLSKKRNSETLEKYNERKEVGFDPEYNVQEQLIAVEISEETRKILISAIQNLPPKQKEIVYLKFEEEMEYEEISGIMKISRESARKLMYRTLLSLRKTFHRQKILILFTYLKKV